MRTYWDTAEVLLGYRLEDIVCVWARQDASGAVPVALSDGRGRRICMGDARDPYVRELISKNVCGARLVSAWNVERAVRALESTGLDLFAPHAFDLAREARVAGMDVRTFGRMCSRLGVPRAAEGSWRVSACLRALLRDEAYLAFKTRLNERALREVRLLAAGDEVVAGRRNDARLVRCGGNYVCYAGGVRVGMACCDGQVRELLGIGAGRDVPDELACSVEPREGARGLAGVAVISGRGAYRDAVAACARIKVESEGRIAPEAGDAPSRSSLRLVYADRSSAPQPFEPGIRVRGIQ